MDDLTTVSPTHTSLQRKMDIVSAFAIVFSLLVNIPKLKLLRTPGRSAPLPPHLIIHTGQWEPQPVQFTKETTIRHLGYHLDHDGSDNHQYQLAMSKIRRGCNILTTRYASPDTKKIILRTVIFSQAMYAAKFCNWSLDQCRDLDKPIEAVYRIITKNMASFPTLLLYLATQMGGLGLPRFSDNLQLEKWQMIHRLLKADPGSQATAWYFIESSIRTAGHTTPPQAATLVSSPNPYPNVLRSVIEWGQTIGLTLWRGGRRFSSTLPDCPLRPGYRTQTDALPLSIRSRIIAAGRTTVDDLLASMDASRMGMEDSTPDSSECIY